MIKHAILIVGFLATPALGVIIDDFSVCAITVETDYDNTDNGVAQTGLDRRAVIGGTRFITLGLDPGQPGDVGFVTVDTTTETLHIEATTPDGFEQFRMSWAALSIYGTALDANLLADGADAFQIDVVSSSGTSLSLRLTSGFNEGAVKDDSWTVRFPPSDFPYSLRVPFSLFPDVDFRDIDSFTFRGSPPRFSLTLDAIRTVPEPSTLVTLILGLVGVTLIRRL